LSKALQGGEKRELDCDPLRKGKGGRYLFTEEKREERGNGKTSFCRSVSFEMKGGGGGREPPIFTMRNASRGKIEKEQNPYGKGEERKFCELPAREKEGLAVLFLVEGRRGNRNLNSKRGAKRKDSNLFLFREKENPEKIAGDGDFCQRERKNPLIAA